MTVVGKRWIVPTMDVKEFEDLIDRLGEDISQWPDVQRQAATELLANSAEACALLEEARVLRDALTAPAVRAPAGLADRIVAAAIRSNPAPSHAEDEAQPTPADAIHPG
jgi:hypothetical protein